MKGSSPLKLNHIGFEDYSYQEITSKEKLLEVLSYLLWIGDFSQYAGKIILNNVYMDLRGKVPTYISREQNICLSNVRKVHHGIVYVLFGDEGGSCFAGDKRDLQRKSTEW